MVLIEARFAGFMVFPPPSCPEQCPLWPRRCHVIPCRYRCRSDKRENLQRFVADHTDEIISMAVHPSAGRFVATGEARREGSQNRCRQSRLLCTALLESRKIVELSFSRNAIAVGVRANVVGSGRAHLALRNMSMRRGIFEIVAILCTFWTGNHSSS